MQKNRKIEHRLCISLSFNFRTPDLCGFQSTFPCCLSEEHRPPKELEKFLRLFYRIPFYNNTEKSQKIHKWLVDEPNAEQAIKAFYFQYKNKNFVYRYNDGFGVQPIFDEAVFYRNNKMLTLDLVGATPEFFFAPTTWFDFDFLYDVAQSPSIGSSAQNRPLTTEVDSVTRVTTLTTNQIKSKKELMYEENADKENLYAYQGTVRQEFYTPLGLKLRFDLSDSRFETIEGNTLLNNPGLRHKNLEWVQQAPGREVFGNKQIMRIWEADKVKEFFETWPEIPKCPEFDKDEKSLRFIKQVVKNIETPWNLLPINLELVGMYPFKPSIEMANRVISHAEAYDYTTSLYKFGLMLRNTKTKLEIMFPETYARLDLQAQGFSYPGALMFIKPSIKKKKKLPLEYHTLNGFF